VIEVLPTQLIPDGDEVEGKVLRVKLIMKEGVEHFSPVYLFDEGSTVSWIPCGRKLSCSYPGIKFACYPDVYFGHEVMHSPIISAFKLTTRSAGPCIQQDAYD
jgi:phosphoribulokinase